MVNSEYDFLTPHRLKNPFDDPACKMIETNFYEYLFHCYENSRKPRVESVWTKLNNKLLPIRCSIVRKVPGYGNRTGLVINSSDRRLVGFVLCESQSHPRKHLFTRPKRTLYSKAIYYPSADPRHISEPGLDLISKLGLTQAIIHLLTMLPITTNPVIQTNINNFSDLVDLRPEYVKESWPRFRHN